MPITGELKGQVDHIWDAFASGGISNPLSVIEQFTYLIYIRGLDKKQTQLESIARLTGNALKNSLFSDIQKPLRWSSFKDQDPGLNVGTLVELEVIFAPYALQNQFAERVNAIEAQKTQTQASLAQAEDLFNSLLQRAFKGELTN